MSQSPLLLIALKIQATKNMLPLPVQLKSCSGLAFFTSIQCKIVGLVKKWHVSYTENTLYSIYYMIPVAIC